MNYILKNENAIYHECGFSCDNVIYIKCEKGNFFITDARYTTEAKEIIKNAEVLDGQRSLLDFSSKFLKSLNLDNLIYDPLQWCVYDFEKLTNDLKTTLLSEFNFSQKQRIIKTDEEIKIIKQAVKKGEMAFERFAEFIKNEAIGLSEKKIQFQAQCIFKDFGELGLSFEPIVAINENAAKPHALPGDVILKENDLLLLDAGVRYKGYCSDRTRTSQVSKNFNFQKNQVFNDSKMQKIYNVVLKSQLAGINAVKPGIKASEVDRACREVIENEGFGEFFIHSTGHGVGLDIHELPVISKTSDTILQEGMVLTVEPGIYLPKQFGVRIEDMVLVTKNGGEVL